MKKFLSVVLSLSMICSISVVTFAAEPSVDYVEELSVSDALADPEIVSFLIENDELDDLYQAQEEIRDSVYASAAECAAEAINEPGMTSDDIQYLTEKFDLDLPCETAADIIDEGTIIAQRSNSGTVIDIWYLFYTVTSDSFIVNAALVDSDNPLDLISGTITRYFLNDETWAKKDSKTFSKSIVTNGPVYTWRVQKWGVKEKFEYNITVKDNGKSHKYDNINKHILSRYNFEAKPYDSFSANGGQRHHFIASAALSKNNFNSRKAYCIRMMAADHRKTGSYGSAAYVNQVSDLLKNKKYEEALQKEVDDFKSNNDTEGIAGSLQQKYYNEVVICLANYTKLFGI